MSGAPAQPDTAMPEAGQTPVPQAPAAETPTADAAVGPTTTGIVSIQDLTAMGHVPDERPPGALKAAEEFFLRGMPAGVIETSPAVGSMIYGARYGAGLSPYMPPQYKWVPPAAGGVLGFGFGLLTGKQLSDAIVGGASSEALMPYFEGGKTLGSSIAFAPAAFYIPVAAADRVGKYVTAMGEFARKSPKSYMLGETMYGAGSSVGTILAEEFDPNDPTTRFLAEVAGGTKVLNPLFIIPTLTAASGRRLKDLWSLRTQEGRQAAMERGNLRAQDEATRRLIDIFDKSGEDINALIKSLDEEFPGAGAGPTSAQKTGSLTLAQLEATLSALDPNFSATIRAQGKDALIALTKTVAALQNAGSPEALRAAAEVREEFFTNAIKSRLERAYLRAAGRISRITRDSPEARVEIGRNVRKEVEQALFDARKAERYYWQLADQEAVKPAGQVRVPVAASETFINKSYRDWAVNILDNLKKMRANDRDFNNPRVVSRLIGEKAQSISEFIKSTGGIADVGGELAARDITNKSYPGLIRRATPENTRGLEGYASMDAVRERLFDAGFFTGKRNYNDISDSEIADAIARDLSGDRVWNLRVRAKLDPYLNEREVLDSWAAEGFDPGMTVEQIATRARTLDDLSKREGREPQYVRINLPAGEATKLIPRPRQLTAENTVRAYLERVSQVGPALVDDMVPASVRKIMESFGIGDNAIAMYRRGRATDQFAQTGVVHYRYLPDKKTLEKIKPGDLINYRSNLLDLARQARGRGDPAEASFYSELADAMLQDLNKLDNPAYNKAREFSSALNDTFTRTFAGELLSLTSKGAARYPAETLVDDAFGVGADLVALRMKEIEGAVGFMRDRLKKAAAEAGPVVPGLMPESLRKEADMLRELAQVSTQGVVSIQDAHNRVLRLLASKALFTDPKTNSIRINTRQLTEFVAENKALLDRLGITADLTNAVQAENLLRGVIEQNSVLNRTVRKQMAFSRLLPFENLTDAITRALNSRTPMRSMAQIARTAQRHGPDAMAGLKASIYEYAFTKATGGKDDVIDPKALLDAFFKKSALDQPALADILRTQGIMAPEELKNVRTLANKIMMVKDAMANKRALEDVLQGADVVGELAMRVLGAKIGTAASGGGPGSLIAASAGSKAIRQIFDKMPMMMVRKTMQQAIQDPAFLSMLLRRNLSEREKFRMAKSMYAYLLASGLNYATYEEPPEAKAAAEAPSASQDFQSFQDVYNAIRPKPIPPAPATRGVPNMPKSGAPGGAPAGGPPPTTGGPTQSRLMMQQLFPNDAILGAAGVASNPAMMPPPAMG